MNEFIVLIASTKEWLSKGLAISKINNSWMVIPYMTLSLAIGIMFPTEAYITAFFSLILLILLDTGTRIYAQVKKERRFFGAVTSHRLWNGICGKLFVLLVFSIMLGILHNVEVLYLVSTVLFTVFYGVLSLREIYSILENLFDAGHTQVDVFLKIVKLKEKQILKDNNIDL